MVLVCAHDVATTKWEVYMLKPAIFHIVILGQNICDELCSMLSLQYELALTFH